MKTRIPLYAFMPYGAPELIEAERTHMLRALLAASLLVPALLLAAFTLATRFASIVAPPERIVDIGSYVLPPPPPLPEYVAPSTPIARPPAIAKGGEVVPVVDERADPTATLPSQDDMNRAQPGLPEGTTTGPGTVVAPPEDVPPDPDAPAFVEELPSIVQRVVPDYPGIARDANVEGTVVVRALVGRDGRVRDARIAPGRSVPMLDEAALAAVRQWVFTPALNNGHPVMVWVHVPVVFRLH